MTSQGPDDIDADLLRRYHNASASEPATPSEAVRLAILAEASRIAKLNEGPAPRAARWSNWKFAAFGTLSAAVLAGFLIIPRFRDGSQTAAPVAVAVQPALQVPAPSARPMPSETPMPNATQELAKMEAPPRSRVTSKPSSLKGPMETVEADSTGSGVPEAGLAAAASSAPPAASSLRAAAAPNLMNAPVGERPERNDSLLSAAQSGELAKIVSLLDRGAAINQRDENGRSALMIATIGGRLDAVQLLLDRGADPNAADHVGRTALQEAQLHGFTGIVRLLERAGAH